MEGDSTLICPDCSSPWGIVEGTNVTCGRCGYKQPSYAQLLKENKELKERLEENTRCSESQN